MSGELSRRRALQIAALGAIGTIAGGVGIWRSFIGAASKEPTAGPGEVLRQPQVMSSRDGSLEVRLRAASGARVAGRPTRALAYNGTVPGPTIRVRPGDRLRVDLINDLSGATNLHTHGLHVSPEGASDDVFRQRRCKLDGALRVRHPRGSPAGNVLVSPAPARQRGRAGVRGPLRRHHRRGRR